MFTEEDFLSVQERNLVLEAEVAHLKEEVVGYQEALTEFEKSEGRTFVLVKYQGGTMMRIFGSNPNREEAFAKTIADYLMLLWEVEKYLTPVKKQDEQTT